MHAGMVRSHWKHDAKTRCDLHGPITRIPRQLAWAFSTLQGTQLFVVSSVTPRRYICLHDKSIIFLGTAIAPGMA